MSKPKIECRHAYCFDCDNCGRENFVRAVAFEGGEEEMEEAREHFGLDDDDEGDFEMYPSEVTCLYCGTKFDVEYPGAICEEDE